MKNTSPHIVLASSSLRRRELISPFELNITVAQSNFDESSFLWNMEDVGQSACQLAYLKAKEVQKSYPSSIIIGADTIVYFEGEVLGKPKNKEDAKKTLQLLSGKTHTVISGCSIISHDKERFVADTTDVTFFPLKDEHIDRYLESTIWMDKAAGYAIQGVHGALFVQSIKGCYYNVMGFPLGKLSILLEEFGVSLWKALPIGLKK